MTFNLTLTADHSGDQLVDRIIKSCTRQMLSQNAFYIFFFITQGSSQMKQYKDLLSKKANLLASFYSDVAADPNPKVFFPPEEVDAWGDPEARPGTKRLRGTIGNHKYDNKSSEALAAALLNAVRGGHAEIVNMILKTGAVDAGANNNAALQEVCVRGDVTCLRLLIQHAKSDLDVAADNYSALCWAMANNHVGVVTILLTEFEVKLSTAIDAAFLSACRDALLNTVTCVIRHAPKLLLNCFMEGVCELLRGQHGEALEHALRAFDLHFPPASADFTPCLKEALSVGGHSQKCIEWLVTHSRLQSSDDVLAAACATGSHIKLLLKTHWETMSLKTLRAAMMATLERDSAQQLRQILQHVGLKEKFFVDQYNNPREALFELYGLALTQGKVQCARALLQFLGFRAGSYHTNSLIEGETVIRSSLEWFCYYGSHPTVGYLLQYELPDERHAASCVYLALRGDHASVIDCLYSHCASFSVFQGCTLLLRAMETKKPKSALLLIQSGQVDNSLSTLGVLEWAVKHRYYAIIWELTYHPLVDLTTSNNAVLILAASAGLTATASRALKCLLKSADSSHNGPQDKNTPQKKRKRKSLEEHKQEIGQQKPKPRHIVVEDLTCDERFEEVL